MGRKIVLDLETQKDLREVGGHQNLHLLKVSVVGIYDYSDNKYKTFEEQEIPQLEEILKKASLIIGFNHKRFDFPVLQPYLSLDLGKVPYLDIMEEFVKARAHRIGLNNLAQATLKEGKSGNGLEALRLYRIGDMENLKNYCLDDVRLTKELYEYGLKYRCLYFRPLYSFLGKSSISVNWK
jgi:hypothetical protein